jgi:hypothetical protein
VASRATASKNSNRHIMLNVIQHGVTIANLQIRRKGSQCGFRNIGDWGEGINHVGKILALVVLSLKGFWHQKTEHKYKGSRSKKIIGGNERAGPPNLTHHKPALPCVEVGHATIN